MSSDDVELVRQACAAQGLRLEAVHLLTADKQQVVPLGQLSLWPARARLYVLAHWPAFLALALLLAGASYYGYLALEARARQAALETLTLSLTLTRTRTRTLTLTLSRRHSTPTRC